MKTWNKPPQGNADTRVRVASSAVVCCALLLCLTFAGSASATTVTAVFGDSIGGINTTLPGSPTATNEYAEVITPGSFLFTPPGSTAGGFFDAAEPLFQGGGAAPVPDDTGLVFFSGVTPVTPALNIVFGFEEGAFTFSGLTPGGQYTVEVAISDLEDLPLTVGLGGPPVLETVAISGNGVGLGDVTAIPAAPDPDLVIATLGVIAIADLSGDLTIGINQVFAWDPLAAPPVIGSQTGIRVERLSVTAIPEPGSLALIGLGTFIMLKRQKRTRPNSSKSASK